MFSVPRFQFSVKTEFSAFFSPADTCSNYTALGSSIPCQENILYPWLCELYIGGTVKPQLFEVPGTAGILSNNR